MTGRFWQFLTGLLAVCTVVLTVLVVLRQFAPKNPAGSGTVPAYVKDWRQLAAVGHRIGPEGAEVTIVEFGDFQCPFCRVFHDLFQSLRQRFGDSVALVFRQFPLSVHPQAFNAGVAAECASEQGHFESIYDALFDGQDSLTSRPLSRYAESAGVPDMKRFAACLHSKDAAKAVSQDRASALALGVAVTPTLLVNGRRIAGAPSQSKLVRMVSSILASERH